MSCKWQGILPGKESVLKMTWVYRGKAPRGICQGLLGLGYPRGFGGSGLLLHPLSSAALRVLMSSSGSPLLRGRSPEASETPLEAHFPAALRRRKCQRSWVGAVDPSFAPLWRAEQLSIKGDQG